MTLDRVDSRSPAAITTGRRSPRATGCQRISPGIGRRLRALMVALAVVSPGVTAHAGGLYLYEIGTRDAGLASAGWAARAAAR